MSNRFDQIVNRALALITADVETYDAGYNGIKHMKQQAIISGRRKAKQEIMTAMPDTSKVTRFEVIDHTGRVLVYHGVSIELSYQDEGQTLKVFVQERSNE